MSKRISYFEYGTVYPPPFVDGQPPAQPEPDAPPSLRAWSVLAVLWYICHAALIGAAYVTLTIDAEGYCTSPLQVIGGFSAPFALWAVTLFVRHQARKAR